MSKTKYSAAHTIDVTGALGLWATTTVDIVGGLTIKGTEALVGASPYAVVASDAILKCVTSGGAIHIDLPAAASHTGRILVVTDWSGAAAASNIVIDGNGSNVQGAASYTIASNGGSVVLHCDGAEWRILAMVA